MPLYEYFCDNCEEPFEALVSLSASKPGVYSCPTCGERSRRILSAVNFAAERQTHTLPASRGSYGKQDVTSLTLPPAARLCWMDSQSAARLAAYKAGRGAEYDDTVAARKELALRGGENEPVNGGRAMTSHSSPLSDPAVLANRRKAAVKEAVKEKVVESASIAKSSTAKDG